MSGEAPERDVPDDQVVWTVVWLLGLAHVVQSYFFYRWPARWWFGFPHNPNRYYNYVFVCARLAILLGLAFLQAACSSWWATTLVAFYALWCAAEIILWYLTMLLDKGHELLSPERNLLFLIINSAEMVLALALLLALGGGALPGAWLDALSALTLNGVNYGGGWATTVVVLGTISGLTLVAAGLALLIGLITPRFQGASTTKRYEYQGPSRPPRPPWLGGTRAFSDRIRVT